MAITIEPPEAEATAQADPPTITVSPDAPAFGYLYINVGVDISHDQSTAETLTLNTGVDIEHDQAAAETVTANVGVDAEHDQAATGYIYTFQTGDVPTPHIWYLRPNFGREGWEYKVVGHGFGATQGTYAAAQVLLNTLGCSIISWATIAATDTYPTHHIDENNDDVTVEHEEIRAIVPTGATSGLVTVEHDEPA